MKRIIHVISGLKAGGAEGVLMRLVINDEENEHLVVSLKDLGFFGQQLMASGINVETLELNKVRNIFLGIGIIKLFWLIKKFKPDVLMTWMLHACFFGGIIGKIAGVENIIWNFRGAINDLSEIKFTFRIIFILCKYLSPIIPSKTVACAFAILQSFKSHGFKSKNFVVIHNGYDINEYKRDDVSREKIRSELLIADEMPLIGMIARWDPKKNHTLLIDALRLVFKRGENFKCLLMGEGMLNKDISGLIDQYGLNDSIILRKESDNIPAVMSALDVHVLSSGYGEGFSNVTAEAMACNVPCISTNTGDSKIIIGKTGWIIRMNSKEEIADKIIEVLQLWKNKESWKKRSDQARARIVENFQVSKMVDSYQELY